jgi:hypothetical protein|tara:strand:+ start:3821 stop:4000 length:180 start_codon:yes stop_codon:yes gene_type:complete
MGFNKRYLPELEDLKRRRIELGDTFFYKIYITSPDAVIGPTESINYINRFNKEYTDAIK